MSNRKRRMRTHHIVSVSHGDLVVHLEGVLAGHVTLYRLLERSMDRRKAHQMLYAYDAQIQADLTKSDKSGCTATFQNLLPGTYWIQLPLIKEVRIHSGATTEVRAPKLPLK